MKGCKTIGISGLEYYTLGVQFNHFQNYFIKILSHKKEIETSARLWPIINL